MGFTQDFYSQQMAERIVKKILKNKEIVLSERKVLNKGMNLDEPIVIYRFLDQTVSENKFAVFTKAKGRYDYFDYVMILNANYVVQKVDVIKYRSEHGGEIASIKWLAQFENYSSGRLTYGTDISAISGATISAGSITEDIPFVISIINSQIK